MIDNKPILLVEDDRIDATAIARALRDLNVANPVVHAMDGEDALNYLQAPESELPGLILLDLNLPIMSGTEFLRIAKADSRLRSIPVVVLTTSRLSVDKLASFELSVAGYMIKPIDYGELVEVVKTIQRYWTASETP